MQKLPALLQTALEKLHIRQLNEIQTASLKATESFDNVVILAPTGKGKTLGFLLPILKKLQPDNKEIQALILAPSRELALQIESVFKTMGTGFKVNCCYGGHSMRVEKDNLRTPPAVLVGTPGRIADLIEKNRFALTSIQTLVLDEFDKSLELGFEEDMGYIINALPNLKKRILTSATNMDEIPSFTGIKSFEELNFLSELQSSQLKLHTVRAEGDDKLHALFLLLCKLGDEASLVFCNHRDAVDRISDLLYDTGIQHAVFHGGLDQDARERALVKFRNGTVRTLITTDLAARGLDIPSVRNVIHYQLATTLESFTHRNGRTARMDAAGKAFLLLSGTDTLPNYVSESPEEIVLEENASVPESPKWMTLYFGGGRKDKISKGDIVGLLLQKAGLMKEEVGLIEVKDFFTYAAVIAEKAKNAVSLLKNEKVKKKKVKIDISR